MSWDLIDAIPEANLDSSSDQPARARVNLRRLVRNQTHIANARGAANGIASLDANRRLDPRAVRIKGFGGLNIPESGTDFAIAAGAGANMEFTHGGGPTAGMIDLGTYPDRITIPDTTPNNTRARAQWCIRWDPSAVSAFDIRAELWKNGALISPATYSYGYSPAGSLGRGMFNKPSPFSVTDGDYFTLRIVHDHTSAVDCRGYFEVMLLQ